MKTQCQEQQRSSDALRKRSRARARERFLSRAEEEETCMPCEEENLCTRL